MRSSLSTLIKGPPTSERMEAVPRRTWRPREVAGLEVPGRLPLKASPTETAPDWGLEDVPGLAKPVMGRPALVIGRVLASGPLPAAEVVGRFSEVPGLQEPRT